MLIYHAEEVFTFQRRPLNSGGQDDGGDEVFVLLGYLAC